MTVRQLAEPQLQTFDHDYVSDRAFATIVEAIRHDFPNGNFSFLDVGGGRGFFADRLLEEFPSATCTVLDNAELLLSQNTTHPRKTLVLGSATEAAHLFPNDAFGIIFFNSALHHFVGKSYAETRRIQRDALAQARLLLAPGGGIIVTEVLYDGVLIHDLPGYLIYLLTSSSALAPLIKRLGANTAGCGVCFLSSYGWRGEFRRLGLRESVMYLERTEVTARWFAIRLRLLAVRSRSQACFWLAS